MNKKNTFNLLVGLFILTVFAAIFIPAVYDPISPNVYSNQIKNELFTGIKECRLRNSNNLSTNFSDIRSFSALHSKFKIQPIDPNSCFKAKAIPNKEIYTWFEIVYDPETEEVLKTCGDSTKLGCKEGNTW